MSSNVLTSTLSPTNLTPDPLSIESYKTQACLSEDQLVDAALRRICYELDLPAGDRERAVLDRLRDWLALDRDKSRYLAVGYNRAMERLTPREKDDIRELEKDAVYNGLTFYEFELLTGFVPAMKDWQASVARSASSPFSPYAFIAAAMGGANA